MKKYIYRGLFALLFLTALSYFMGYKYPLLLLLEIVQPILFPMALMMFAVPTQLHGIILFGIFPAILIYFALSDWLKSEFPDIQNITRKKLGKFIIPFSILPALIASPFLIGDYQKVQKKKAAEEELVPIDMDKIRIENYKETPFYQWGSKSPVGLQVEFDLVGENQAQLFIDLEYSYLSKNMYNQGSSSSHGSICLSYDAAMEAARTNLGGKFIDTYFKKNFLLMAPSRNHVTFICDSPFILRNLNGDENFLLWLNNDPELIKDAEEAAKNEISQDVRENITVLLGVRSVEVGGEALSFLFTRDVPKNSLIFNKNFWLNQTERNLGVHLIAGGYSDCSDHPKYKGRKGYFCKKAP
jgi:hypothetical protein